MKTGSYADLAGEQKYLAPFGLSIDIESKIFKVLSALSLCSSMVVAILGIDTMRGRGMTRFPIIEDIESLMTTAFDESDKYYTETWRIAIIRNINDSLIMHREQASRRGKKLRYMSYGLLFSIAMSFLTLLC